MGTEFDENDKVIPSKDCYPVYSEDAHSEEPYGPGDVWTYEKTDSPLVRGPSDTDFGGNGFIIRLSYNPIVAAEQIAFIEENGWIDSQTRAIIITVNGFNPNLNKFTSAFIVLKNIYFFIFIYYKLF